MNKHLDQIEKARKRLAAQRQRYPHLSQPPRSTGPIDAVHHRLGAVRVAAKD